MNSIIIISNAPVHIPTLKILNAMVWAIRGKELQTGEMVLLKDSNDNPQVVHIMLNAGKKNSKLRRRMDLLVMCTTSGKPYGAKQRRDGTTVLHYHASPQKVDIESP